MKLTCWNRAALQYRFSMQFMLNEHIDLVTLTSADFGAVQVDMLNLAPHSELLRREMLQSVHGDVEFEKLGKDAEIRYPVDFGDGNVECD